jgi:glyoxylase-like metal-dependent hydrolase (beta-lactamase superfamily II)
MILYKMRKLILASLGVAIIATLSSCAPEPIDESINQQVQGESKDNWWDALPRAQWSPFEKIAVQQNQDWFQVYRIREGVYGIYEDGQFEEVISYLITGSENALLFDTGIGVGDISAIVKQLTGLPVSVLNSHTHYDHVGGNHLFEKLYGVASAYTVDHMNGRTNDEVKEFIGPGWTWKPLPDSTTVDNYSSAAFSITDYVSDGYEIDLGGRVLEVILVPGHTPDALVLLDRENRLMFTGDTFYPASLYAHMGDADFFEYAKSAEKLAGFRNDVDYLLPAHNEPLVAGYYLTAMRDAFNAIQAPNAPFRLAGADREYLFDGFSIMVSEPPPWRL